MKIEISQEDFDMLCVCALRYCNDTRSNITDAVQNIVLQHKKKLSDNAKRELNNDFEYQLEMDLFDGDRHSEDWIKFYREVCM